MIHHGTSISSIFIACMTYDWFISKPVINEYKMIFKKNHSKDKLIPKRPLKKIIQKNNKKNSLKKKLLLIWQYIIIESRTFAPWMNGS